MGGWILGALLALGSFGLLLAVGRDAAKLRKMLLEEKSPDRLFLAPMRGLQQAIQQRRDDLRAHTEIVAQRQQADEAIISRLPDPLLIVAPDRQVLRSNPAAQAAFGREIGALLRHPLLCAAIDQAIATGEAQTAELLLPVPTQRDIAATVIVLDPEMRDKLLLVLADRSRERALERMRADFVANASHELRSPLSSVIGFIETLRGPAANDTVAQAKFLKIMAEQAWRMNRLIDDLLSLAQIEIGEHRPPTNRIDLEALARTTLEATAPTMQAASISGVLDVADRVDAVLGDADQLAQVLRNLVDNAIKYGKPDGSVRIAIRPALPTDNGPGAMGTLIAVSDDGAGIPARHLPRLTERFYRVDAGRSRAVGGTGLGLAIVKHIVLRHRGRLTIESKEGMGTTVMVWLPAITGKV